MSRSVPHARLLPALAVLATLLLLAPPALAQRRGGFGIGGQVGDPTGVTLKLGVGRGAIDLAAGFDLSSDDFFAQGHYLLAEQGLSGAPVNVYYGPGLFIAGDGDGAEDDVAFGFSFNLGLNYYTGPLEFFGQVTPRLQLIDETDFDVGGAIGLRYYP